MARLTNISPHTIRAWERRYNLFCPGRNNNNCRYYENQDLRLLQNLHLLTQNNYKISKLATLSKHEIDGLAENFRNDILNIEKSQNCISSYLLNFDEEGLTRFIRLHVCERGLLATIDTFVIPFLNKVFESGLNGTLSTAQENLLNNVVRKEIILEEAKLSPNYDPRTPSILLYPQSNMRFYFGLPLINYSLKMKGYKTIELGYYTHIEDIEEILLKKNINAIVTVWNNALSPTDSSTHLYKLSKMADKIKVLLVNKDINFADKYPSNIRIFPDVKCLISYLEQWEYSSLD